MNDQAIAAAEMVYCLGCGYCLTGISTGLKTGRCPECGQAFDRSRLSFHPTHNPRTAVLLKWSRRLYYTTAITWLLLVMVGLMVILMANTLPAGSLDRLAFIPAMLSCMTLSVMGCGLLMLIPLTPLCINTLGYANTIVGLLMIFAMSCCFFLGLIIIPPLLINQIELLWQLRPVRREADWSAA